MSLAKLATRGFFINYGTRLIEFGLTFAINLIVIRELGPALFGLYTAVLTFAGIFALLANLGFEESINANIPKLRDFKEKVSYLFTSILGIRIIVLSITGFAIYYLASPIAAALDAPTAEKYLRLAIPFIFFANINSIFTFLFTALFRFGTLAIGKVTLLVLQLIGVLTIFHLGMGIEGLIYVLAIINFCVTIIYLIIGLKYISVKRAPDMRLKRIFWFGLTVWLINIATFGLGRQSDIVIMGFLNIPNEQIGYYGIAFGLTNTLNTLALSGFFGLSFSTLAAAAEKKDNSLGIAWSVFVKLSSLMIAPGLFFTIVFAEPLITGLYGKDYQQAVFLYQVFASLMLFTRFAGGKNHMIALYTLEKQNLGFVIRLIMGIFNVVLNFILIPKYQALGALIATGISAFLMSVIEMIILLKFTGSKFPMVFSLKILFASVIAVIPFYLVFPRSIILLVISGILFYCLTVLLLLVLKPLNNDDLELINNYRPGIGKFAAYFSRVKKN